MENEKKITMNIFWHEKIIIDIFISHYAVLDLFMINKNFFSTPNYSYYFIIYCSSNKNYSIL